VGDLETPESQGRKSRAPVDRPDRPTPSRPIGKTPQVGKQSFCMRIPPLVRSVGTRLADISVHELLGLSLRQRRAMHRHTFGQKVPHWHEDISMQCLSAVVVATKRTFSLNEDLLRSTSSQLVRVFAQNLACHLPRRGINCFGEPLLEPSLGFSSFHEDSSVSSLEPLYSPEVASFGHTATPTPTLTPTPISMTSSKCPDQTAAYIVPINLPGRFCMNREPVGLEATSRVNCFAPSAASLLGSEPIFNEPASLFHSGRPHEACLRNRRA
ncbi:unnamed protein product, partial [Protopolystoma xenopodis]